MKIRKVLIIITSSIIVLMFILVSSISYNLGINYGEENAEKIREKRAYKSNEIKKSIKGVRVISTKNNTDTYANIYTSGRINSINNITISSEVQGRLIGKNTFKKGRELKKGDIIFQIENSDYKLLINAKKSRFMNLISSILADIKLDFPNEYKKWNDYFISINLTENLNELPNTNSVKEKNFIVSRSIMSEYLSIKSDEFKLGKYTVLAPFDGIITKSYTDVGANINPGSPIIDFIRKDNLEVELYVSVKESKLIEIGDKVIFNIDNKTYNGKILRKGNFINSNTQNISVFSDIEKNVYLFDGMYINATINSKINIPVTKIPKRCIFNKNNVFFVNEKNKLVSKKIDIIFSQDNIIFTNSISDKTLVVAEPLINAKEGTLVKPIVK